MHRNRMREARAKLIEARDLASINGLERLVADLHPLIDEILGELRARTPTSPVVPAPAMAPSQRSRPSPAGY